MMTVFGIRKCHRVWFGSSPEMMEKDLLWLMGCFLFMERGN